MLHDEAEGEEGERRETSVRDTIAPKMQKQGVGDTRERANKWAVFAIVATGVFMSTLDSSIVNISLPTIARYFGVPLSGAIEWIVISYLVVIAAVLLGFSTLQGGTAGSHAVTGIVTALGASLLWGTMYVPYRKAYISGMNPLSFVTVFTFGELGTVFALAVVFDGGFHHLVSELGGARPVLFWLFLGGFCWVIGDLFQQYAAKYLGISRGIPLSNTNQLWGLAWGALVFGELAGQGAAARTLVIAGSVVMIAGAALISFAEPPEAEYSSWRKAMERECSRYGLDPEQVAANMQGEETREQPARRWWEWMVLAAAIAIFVWLGSGVERHPVTINPIWMAVLVAASLVFLAASGVLLWKRTRFS